MEVCAHRVPHRRLHNLAWTTSALVISLKAGLNLGIGTGGSIRPLSIKVNCGALAHITRVLLLSNSFRLFTADDICTDLAEHASCRGITQGRFYPFVQERCCVGGAPGSFLPQNPVRRICQRMKDKCWFTFCCGVGDRQDRGPGGA
jgi:hypothetical protein